MIYRFLIQPPARVKTKTKPGPLVSLSTVQWSRESVSHLDQRKVFIAYQRNFQSYSRMRSIEVKRSIHAGKLVKFESISGNLIPRLFHLRSPWDERAWELSCPSGWKWVRKFENITFLWAFRLLEWVRYEYGRYTFVKKIEGMDQVSQNLEGVRISFLNLG